MKKTPIMVQEIAIHSLDFQAPAPKKARSKPAPLAQKKPVQKKPVQKTAYAPKIVQKQTPKPVVKPSPKPVIKPTPIPTPVVAKAFDSVPLPVPVSNSMAKMDSRVPAKPIAPTTKTIAGVSGNSTSSTPVKTSNRPTGGESKQATIAYKPSPFYPTIAKRMGKQGQVIVKISIDKTGKPVQIDMIKPTDFPPLNKAALETARQYRFKPALKNGIPTTSTMVIAIIFKLS